MLTAPYNAFILYSHDADEVLQPVAATLHHEIKDIRGRMTLRRVHDGKGSGAAIWRAVGLDVKPLNIGI